LKHGEVEILFKRAHAPRMVMMNGDLKIISDKLQ